MLARRWTRAGDCESLDRLWTAAISCGAVQLRGRRATGHVPERFDDETWVDFGVRAGLGLLERKLSYRYASPGLLYALMRSYVRSRAPVSWEEIAGFLDTWEHSPQERTRLQEAGVEWRELDLQIVRHSCFDVRDTGILRESDDGVTLTEFGDVFVTAWLNYTQEMSQQR